MESFVTLVGGWRPQASNITKTPILDIVMALDTPLWNNY